MVIARRAALLLFLSLATGALAGKGEERERSIASFESLLAKYPASAMRAPILLALGNLYAERERGRYLEAVARREDRLAAGARPSEAPRPDYGRAIDAFREALHAGGAFPGRAEALYGLALCYDETGRSAEAEAALAEATACAPAGPLRVSAAIRLGDLRYAARRWDAAREAYETARRAGADRVGETLAYRIGWCLLEQGEVAAAGVLLEEAARDRFAREGCAGAGAAEIVRSLALVQAETDPSGVAAYAGRFPEGSCRRAALAALGEVLLDHDHPSAAEEAFRTALAIDPEGEDAPRLHDWIIEALRAAGQPEAAGLAMEACVRAYGPTSAWARAHGLSGAVREILLRSAWNGALLRYEAGTNEDLGRAALLFEAYAGELGGKERRDRALLFAAQARYRRGELAASARLYDRVDPAALVGEEREAAYHGAVLARRDVAGEEEAFARAAVRYAEAFPGRAEAEKALLLAAGRLDEAGKDAFARALCARLAATAGSPLRGEAALTAARIAAARGDASAAESWFLRAAAAAGDEETRAARIDGAAASAFLAASALEERGAWEEAAEAMRTIVRAYPGTDAGREALLREMACRAHFASGDTLVALADTIAALLSGSDEAASVLRAAAAFLAREARPAPAARLWEGADRIVPSADDLLAAGEAYEEAKREEEAAACYERAARRAGGARAGEALDRLGLLRLAGGDPAGAGAAFDRAFAAGGGRPVELRTRAGAAWRAAGEAERSEARYREAAALFEERGGEEFFAAEAYVALGRLAGGRLRTAIALWRRGAAGAPADLLDEAVGACRAAIALGFEGKTEEAAREAADLLALYGRSAYLREWEAGRLPPAGLVEPHFAGAELLDRAAGRPGRSRHEELADTLAAWAGAALAAAPAPRPPWADFDEGSERLAAHLRAAGRAEELWRGAEELLLTGRPPGEGDARRFLAKRAGLAFVARRVLDAGAGLLRGSPPPPGLTAQEEELYRALVEEKAGAFEERASAWRLAPAGGGGVEEEISRRCEPGGSREGEAR